MIVAQRQSALAKRTVSDNDQFARPPLLILIDAPFRIASSETLLKINLLPHLICSFWASEGIGGHEAGEYDDT